VSLAGALGRFARPARAATPEATACELCSAPAGEPHRHVVDLEHRAVCCACPTCARLFVQPGPGARFRTVPDRVVSDPGRGPAAADWARLGIPVGLAFVFRSARADRWLASFPGPAGTIEGDLPQVGWAAIAARLPLASALEPDVEALLFHGDRGAGALECLLVPIDACYALGGRLRRAWKGFDGGPEARREVDAALAELRARARPLPRGGATEGAR
jgi:hypothetical protein